MSGSRAGVVLQWCAVILVLAVVVGCAPKPLPIIPPVQVSAPPEPSPQETQVSGSQVIVVQGIPDSLKILVGRRWAVKSLSYDFKSTELPYQRSFKIRGDAIAILPATSETLLYKGQYFTTIFVNQSDKTAKAYCDQPNLCREKKKGPFEIPLDLYYSKTPYDWAEELESAKYVPIEQEPGEVLIEGRPTVSYRYVFDGVITQFYIEKFFGLPLRIESVNPDGTKKSVVYDSPRFNLVSQAEVIPQLS